MARLIQAPEKRLLSFADGSWGTGHIAQAKCYLKVTIGNDKRDQTKSGN